MNFKVILPIHGSTDRGGVRELLLQRYKLDYTTLLELALSHWEELNYGDEDILRCALEGYLHRRLPPRRHITFEEFFTVVAKLASAIQQLHAHFQPALSTLLECKRYNGEIDMSLVGWADKCPVIEIRMR